MLVFSYTSLCHRSLSLSAIFALDSLNFGANVYCGNSYVVLMINFLYLWMTLVVKILGFLKSVNDSNREFCACISMVFITCSRFLIYLLLFYLYAISCSCSSQI